MKSKTKSPAAAPRSNKAKPRLARTSRPHRKSAGSLAQSTAVAKGAGDARPTFLADPIDAVDRNLAPEDFEILSFVIAGLSYGRVEQIQRSTRELFRRLEELKLGPTGSGIAELLKKWQPESDGPKLSEALLKWSHRMNTASDLVEVFHVLAQILQAHGSLARLYQKSFAENPKDHVAQFTAKIRALSPEKKLRHKTVRWTGTGLAWFAASPADGGTCKRLMMWLRWMIRRDAIDPGLWQESALLDLDLPRPHCSRLFLPVDTHVFRWARAQGILTQKTPNWAAVEKVTAHFRNLCPEDPVKFDFELCHQGMTQFRHKSVRA